MHWKMEKIMQMFPFGLAVMLLLWGSATSSGTQPGCSDKCGNVIVPYPFGIGDSRCAISHHFLLKCNYAANPPQLLLDTIHVLNVSVEDGTLILSIFPAYDCFNESGWESGQTAYARLGAGPFRFSDTSNKLTALGCDTLALMTDSEGNFGSGCISLCNEQVNFTESGTCSGFGCCQISIPPGLKTLNITIGSPSNHRKVLGFNPCGFAFIADVDSFSVSEMNLSLIPDKMTRSNVVVEWVVEDKKCEIAKGNSNTYACGKNTDCVYSKNAQGYRCSCKEGFEGNPYLGGCQDIDECKDPRKYRCEGSCKNTVGNYTCSCPLGMHGDGKVGCKGFRFTTLATVIGATIFVLVIALLIFIICKKRRKEKNFVENGGMLLKHQRVRIFSEAELAKATRNYDKSQFLGEGGFGSVYKGVLTDNLSVAVKKPKDLDKIQMNQEFQHEIGIISQVNHKNVVKLLGLCLETKVPLLVYEYVSNGTLYQHIHQKRSQILATWINRLKIAADTALALDYLHSLANPPIIHGDIKSMNILLDDHYDAKVSDFGASVLISPDEVDMATKIQGTFGYLDPEYLMTGNLTAKSDVYSFGVVLVELLTGEKPHSGGGSREKGNIIQYFFSSLENDTLSHILCFEVADEDEMEEIQIFAELAKKCLNSRGVKRPSMKEVAEELARLTKLHGSLWNQQKSEETEHLLGESSYHCSNIMATKINQPDIYTESTFEIDYCTDSI